MWGERAREMRRVIDHSHREGRACCKKRLGKDVEEGERWEGIGIIAVFHSALCFPISLNSLSFSRRCLELTESIIYKIHWDCNLSTRAECSRMRLSQSTLSLSLFFRSQQSGKFRERFPHLPALLSVPSFHCFSVTLHSVHVFIALSFALLLRISLSMCLGFLSTFLAELSISLPAFIRVFFSLSRFLFCIFFGPSRKSKSACNSRALKAWESSNFIAGKGRKNSLLFAHPLAAPADERAHENERHTCIICPSSYFNTIFPPLSHCRYGFQFPGSSFSLLFTPFFILVFFPRLLFSVAKTSKTRPYWGKE